jgi:tetratricopeptide (TPR) repeat protein
MFQLPDGVEELDVDGTHRFVPVEDYNKDKHLQANKVDLDDDDLDALFDGELGEGGFGEIEEEEEDEEDMKARESAEKARKLKDSLEKKEQGNAKFVNNEYQAALELYSQGLILDPTNHVMHSNRSACYAGMLNWPGAAAEGKRCIELAPTFVKGYYRLALALCQQEKYDDAMEKVREGLKLEASNRELGLLLRRCLAGIGSKEEGAKKKGGRVKVKLPKNPKLAKKQTLKDRTFSETQEILELRAKGLNFYREIQKVDMALQAQTRMK